MTELMLLDFADTFLVYVTAPIALVLFVAFAFTRSPWWRDVLGWMTFLLTLGIVLILGVSFFFLVLGPEYPARPYFKLGSYLLVTVSFVGLIFIIIHERLKSRNPKE